MTLMSPVHASAAAGLPYLLKVGSPVAAAMKPLALHHCFHQPWLNAVLPQPVTAQMSHNTGEHLAGQIVNPCQNKKTAVVDYMLQP
jgi:hypothetical protein